MERAEAEAIYEQGPETVVALLMELSAQNALLGRQVAELSERLAKQDERIAELERRLQPQLPQLLDTAQPGSARGAGA